MKDDGYSCILLGFSLFSDLFLLNLPFFEYLTLIELSKLQQFILWLIPMIFAITFHEVAHGWAALKLGDRTAQMLGRLSLNPIKHVDFMGTLVVPAVLFFLSGFIFGWAKPVPVTWKNLRNPRRDMMIVALAGPLANIVMAGLWALFWKFSLLIYNYDHPLGVIFAYTSQVGILMNIFLMALNLLPIPPLDGSRIVSSLLSPRQAFAYNQIEPYGFFILLGLMLTGILSKILVPIVWAIHHLISNIFQLPGL